MRIARLALLAGLAFPCALPGQSQSCDLGNSRQLNSIANGAVIYVGGPVFVCNTGTRITADSAVYSKSAGRIDFFHNVHFDEAERELTSQYAQYVGRERRLMAQQDVILVNKKDGSRLRALSLDYFQKSAINPEPRIEVYAGRPRATLYRKRPEDAAVTDTTIVDADRMQIIGEKVFRGWGAVDVTRGKMNSKSAYAEFDQDGSYMKVYGQATVQSDTFRLSADSIDAELVNSDEFKAVRARRDAKLASQNINIDAPVLNIDFADGKVERLVAIGGVRRAKDAKQAIATSTDVSLTADSIDAITPGQKLERVIAVGRAFGERTADSADAKLPALIAKDWVRGDTVKAYFGSAPDTTKNARGARTDSVRVLERIVASGVPASSTYRLREKVKGTDSTELSVNYITARLIDVKLRNGDVDEVHAEGDIRGIYLQPPKREAVAREGSQ